MTLWNPEYRIKVDGSTVTSATLAGLTVTSGRTDIYSQPQAGYANITLLETDKQAITYEINDPITIEVKNTSGTYVYLYGGFISDLNVEVASSGSSAMIQRVNIIAVGAIARLARSVFTGNLSAAKDGTQIYTVLQDLLVNNWNEVAGSLTWAGYDATTTWANAENVGLGEIDTPGQYDLDAQSGLVENVYTLVSELATSGLGYIYEDAQGRIGYADAVHRSQYLSTNGYIFLDGNQAQGPGLTISKRAGDVRNAITINYKANQTSAETSSDAASISAYGRLAAIVNTTLKNQSDAQAQLAFYLAIRAYPQYLMKSITFDLQSPEIDDSDRNSLLNVFMGMPVDIANLPNNMVNERFQGFVEGWTWTAAYNRLRITLNLSPLAFSIQSVQWEDVPIAKLFNNISASLTWNNATIVA